MIKDFFNRMKIVHKMNASFALIILLVVGLSIFTVVSMNNLCHIFSEYRHTARESLVTAEMMEALGNVRIFALKTRMDTNEENIKGTHEHLDELLGHKKEVKEIITEPELLAQFDATMESIEDYRVAFDDMVEMMNQRNEVTEKLVALGIAIREDLTNIGESAYSDGDAEAAYLAGKVQEHLMLARYYANAFLINNKPEDLERSFTELDSANEFTNTMLTALENPQRRQSAEAAYKGLNEYITVLGTVGEIIEKRNEAFDDRMNVIGPQVMAEYNNIFRQVEDRQNELGPRAAATIQQTSTLSIIVSIIIVIFGSSVAFMMGRMLAMQIAQVIAQMTRLADNDLTIEVQGANRRDEIGDIARSLQVFKDNGLERQRLDKEARAAEEAQLKRAETIDKLVSSFEDMIGDVTNTLNHSADELQSMATQLSSAMEETSSQSTNVASAAQQASANVQTVASATEEMVASVKEIAKNVSDTAHSAKICANAATETQKNLDDLQQAVNEVDSVIQSINDVAEQTNLLALNATIEAARAGDAGKGFAVVANEVKSLAGQTHQMTDEISQKVSHIKNSATGTITTVNQILEQITDVDRKSTSVAGAVEEQNVTSAEISRNVHEAAVGTEEVTRNIQGIQEAANQSSASTVQLKSSADVLADKAKNLKSEVQKFLDGVKAA